MRPTHLDQIIRAGIALENCSHPEQFRTAPTIKTRSFRDWRAHTAGGGKALARTAKLLARFTRRSK